MTVLLKGESDYLGLQDINFEVERGGENYRQERAGKSTLLKDIVKGYCAD
jgi:hypothetical protein